MGLRGIGIGTAESRVEAFEGGCKAAGGREASRGGGATEGGKATRGYKGSGGSRADGGQGGRRDRRAVFCGGADGGRCSQPQILLIIVIIVAGGRLWSWALLLVAERILNILKFGVHDNVDLIEDNSQLSLLLLNCKPLMMRLLISLCQAIASKDVMFNFELLARCCRFFHRKKTLVVN